MATPETPRAEITEAQSDLSLKEMIESLDGFEQVSIEDHWSQPLGDISGVKLTIGLIAVANKRAGMNQRDAWQNAMRLKSKEQNIFFREDDVETEKGLDSDEEERA